MMMDRIDRPIVIDWYYFEVVVVLQFTSTTYRLVLVFIFDLSHSVKSIVGRLTLVSTFWRTVFIVQFHAMN